MRNAEELRFIQNLSENADVRRFAVLASEYVSKYLTDYIISCREYGINTCKEQECTIAFKDVLKAVFFLEKREKKMVISHWKNLNECNSMGWKAKFVKRDRAPFGFENKTLEEALSQFKVLVSPVNRGISFDSFNIFVYMFRVFAYLLSYYGYHLKTYPETGDQLDSNYNIRVTWEKTE